MTIKEKVLLALKTKYKNLGLSEDTLATMADSIAARLTEESEQESIDTEVNGVENFLKSFQKEADSRVTNAIKKAKGTPPKTASDAPAEGEEEGEQTDLEKLIAKAIAPLMKEVAGLKGEKVTTTRKQSLEKALENVDAKVKAKALKDFGRMNFNTDEDFDSYLEETVADFEGFEAAGEAATSGGVPQPTKSKGKPETKATSEELTSIVDSIM